MIDSGLPQANPVQKIFRVGNFVIKSQKPTQTTADAEKGLNTLEKAAEEKVFISNEPSE